jgi:hypothetical protein
MVFIFWTTLVLTKQSSASIWCKNPMLWRLGQFVSPMTSVAEYPLSLDFYYTVMQLITQRLYAIGCCEIFWFYTLHQLLDMN